MKPKKELKHRNLVVGLQEALTQFLEPKQYAHRVLERLFKKHKIWGAKDRGFVSEAFYDIIRWKKLYEFYTQKPFTQPYLYDYIVAYLLQNNYLFPTWDILENVNFKTIKKQLKQPITDEATQYSMPEWMLQKFHALPQYKKELKALNQPAKVVLRTNTLKTTKNELGKQLRKEGVETFTLAHYPQALELEQKQNIFTTMAFKQGYFEVQDANSQKVAEIVAPKEGDRVVDACCGAGGKALHLAALMQNKGVIYALDIFDWKLTELKKRAKRDGVHNIQLILVKDTKSWKKLKSTADKVLIDAPCSGSGVLRRNPDSKWKLSEEQFQNILQEQAEILKQYSSMVKTHGELTYVTCSILPEENENQIKKFLQSHSEFSLKQMQTLSPADTGYDGFFIAQMIKI